MQLPLDNQTQRQNPACQQRVWLILDGFQDSWLHRLDITLAITLVQLDLCDDDE